MKDANHSFSPSFQVLKCALRFMQDSLQVLCLCELVLDHLTSISFLHA